MAKLLNIELKARIPDIDSAENIVKKLGAKFHGEDHQVDTYFQTKKGRLKLRSGNIENSLIFYERSNEKCGRQSRIILEELSQNSLVGDILEKSNEIFAIVDKVRKIYFLDNIKIHFDAVKELGEFMEIEVIDQNHTENESALKKQLTWLGSECGIRDKDIIKFSYSDLKLEIPRERLYREAFEFLELLEKNLILHDLRFSLASIDHLCFRVNSDHNYMHYKAVFSNFADLIQESEVGARMISVFKLHSPIIYKNANIDIIELPAPKEKSGYALGYEHAEFVVSDSFEHIQAIYPSLDFDTKALGKPLNSDLRIKFNDGSSIKLHHSSLEEVISHEKKGF